MWKVSCFCCWQNQKIRRKYLCLQSHLIVNKEIDGFLCSCSLGMSLEKRIEKVFVTEEHMLAFLCNCVKGAFSKNSCTASLLTPGDQEQVDTLEPFAAYVAVRGCRLLCLRIRFFFLIITTFWNQCVSSVLRYQCAGAYIGWPSAWIPFCISNGAVLKICSWFGELISGTAVVMKIELTSLSFSSSIKRIVAQSHLNCPDSWERQ